MEPLIHIDNLFFSYSIDEDTPPIPLFEGLSLDFEKGSFTAVLGHNGSGKSTLSRMLNGMLLPEKGTVTVNGLDTAKEENQLNIRKTVGLVFQNPDNQIVSSIVEEDVAFGPENLGLASDEIKKRVQDALAAVDMTEYATHSTGRLSGGQKQRIAIAGMLAMHPTCLVLDEPTAMLDPKGRKEVLDTIHTLNKEQGITVILITHYMEEAATADRCIVLEHGNVLLDGSPNEVFAHRAALEQTGLTMPATCQLAYELADLGFPLSSLPLTEQDCINTIEQLLQ
ncbi:MAG: energy-coupling factor transporter ATPase [Clostridia bacterium]|nr:energy-coupling factor transporter ATPase [Clostridia bacterium]